MTNTIDKYKLLKYLELELNKVEGNPHYYGREQALLGVVAELMNGGFNVDVVGEPD